MTMRRKLFALLILSIACFSTGARSREVALAADHPASYTIAPGDTIWSVAGKFLQDPAQWPQLWSNRHQAEQPLFAGDTLTLVEQGGQARLVLQRGSAAPAASGGEAASTASGKDTPYEIKVQPRIREVPADQAIPIIPLDHIRQFLTTPRVVSPEELADAPRVVRVADEHITGGAGDRIYVAGIEESSRDGYTLFRAGKPYKDGGNGEIVGYESVYVGDTRLQSMSEDVATLLMTRSVREILPGDRLLPIAEEIIPTHYTPHAPEKNIQGHIVGVVDGVTQIGQYNVVILDRGEEDGVEIGHTLDILQRGGYKQEGYTRNFFSEEEKLRLPDEFSGSLLVFRPFERVSYALVMKATRAIHINDIVRTP
ncbi:MAG TPA: LysM domain-containing protein [Methylococcaceae bacterium]|nr:LysM domain-containing protein [Methylococcaceae bacterium]